MKPLVAIVGTTAVGKTDLAYALGAEILKKTQFKVVDLISADSRQVYRGLEVLAGADIPSELLWDGKGLAGSGYFRGKTDSYRLFGVSIIEPNQEWSLAHFQQYALSLIEVSWKEQRFPIIVGGTGLYVSQLFLDDPRLQVAPNEEVRTKSNGMTVAELQQWLQEVNPDRFTQMNHSDAHNPRRLVRAIEQELEQQIIQDNSKKMLRPDVFVQIGLERPLPDLQAVIATRVNRRFEAGAVQEVKNLINQYPDATAPALSTLGVTEIRQYLEGTSTKESCLEQWAAAELAYAKRQITWWKKAENVKWFNVHQYNYQQQIFAYLNSKLAP